MLREITIVMVASISIAIIPSSFANEPNDYITPGRALLFDGSLSGLQSAYQLFDDGLNDANCIECPANRELRFFHAIAGTAMLLARDDGNSINSLLELSQEFGISIIGDYWAPYFKPTTLDFNEVRNHRNVYEIPEDAPDINDIRDILDVSFIPEIQTIIDDLNSIDDSSGDRFKVYLQPDEVRILFPSDSDIFNPSSPDYDPNSRLLAPLEVDYGEVLLLKGLLTALKAQLESKAAYDTYFDPNDKLLEKLYGDNLRINEDILLPHPEILNVLPTTNDSNDGAAILAQARYDYIDAINYYLDAVDYISNEDNPPGTDSQEDEILYLDPNDKDVSDAINSRLITFRDSISNDTIGNYPTKTSKIYNFQDPCSLSTTWALTLNYDIINMPDYEPGSFVASDSNSAPSPWKITNISNDGNELMLEMEYDVPGYWGGAFFSGIISGDSNNITNGTFSYWGPANGTIYNFSGTLINTQIEEKQLDLNPIFGSSARYPDPVNPRDLLPELDQWSAAQPGTLGHGLGDDATLGGILPEMSQYDWQVLLNLQPSGLFYLQEIQFGQKDQDGWIAFWLSEQLVFSDIANDIEDEDGAVENVDIDKLYMVYDIYESGYLHGILTFNDYNNVINSGNLHYELYLTYMPHDESSFKSLKFTIYSDGGSTLFGTINYMNDTYGYLCWEYQGSFEARFGENGVEFRIPWNSIPSYLPGRFISIESGWGEYSWNTEDYEKNSTNLKIGEVGTISGTVTYDDYKGDPLFVQAYTNPKDPDGSVIASTMITEPGPYTLEGIGLGWDGYVRAFTPLFGFDNVFELEAFDIEASVPVFMWLEDIQDVDITLSYPTVLEKDVWESGEINADSREVDWYYFDAVAGGTYTLDLTRGTATHACMSLYGRDGDIELVELYDWQTQQINWLCPANGRYYVEVANGYYLPDGGTYQIKMTSNLTCPQADVACAEWVGVKDCKVDFYDLSALVSHWLDSCSSPYWCDDCDFDESGSVNFTDFATLANEWMMDSSP